MAIGLGVYGVDVGYDPTTGRYLVVAAAGGGTIVGTCTNAAGAPVSAGGYFAISTTPNSQGPRVKLQS